MDPITIAIGLAQFAPALLRYFGAGENSAIAAEHVINVAKDVTNTTLPSEALKRIVANTELQRRFQEAVVKNEAILEKAYLADKANARDRDVEIIKTGAKNRRGDILAYSAISGLLVLIFLLFFKATDIPAGVRDLLLILVGNLIPIVKDVYSFEFGSTRSSKDKDATILNLSGGK